MTLTKDTLVKVREDALDCTVNVEVTDDHGWLWIVEGENSEDLGHTRPIYDCRSLATGHIASWFDYELEIPEKEQADAS